MSDAPATTKAAAAAKLMTALSILALDRTALSSERALMAWMRTSVSLYTFGFSITKFIDYLQQQAGGIPFSAGPRRLGLALVIMGILAVVVGMVEHARRIVRMRQLGLSSRLVFSIPIGAAAALVVIGIVTLIGIALNWPSQS